MKNKSIADTRQAHNGCSQTLKMTTSLYRVRFNKFICARELLAFFIYKILDMEAEKALSIACGLVALEFGLCAKFTAVLKYFIGLDCSSFFCYYILILYDGAFTVEGILRFR